MKVAVLLAFAVLCVSATLAVRVKPLAAQEYKFLFESWMEQHEVQYTANLLNTRYNVWKSNLDAIRHHNADRTQTFTKAMNKFGDLTPEEFKAMYCNLDTRSNEFLRSKNYVHLNVTDAPKSVDWVKAGKVTPVKDQGQCGSCWAFSTTGSTEAAYAIENDDKPISLSEQQLVDCAKPQGNQGCEGGLMDQGFQYIITNGGLTTEKAYPYKALDGTCDTTQKLAVTIKAFSDVPANNLDALQAAVAQQPVSVAVDAESWQFYSGGVMSSACGTSLDHGVLAVGYGTDNGADFWTVKNSWGAGWGESGFIRLARTGGQGSGECGIAMVASYPTGASKVKGLKHRLTLKH